MPSPSRHAIQVVKADVLGFCGGVRRAVSLIEDKLSGGGLLYTLGAVVHNARVIATLAEKGARPVERLHQVPSGSTVAITAHGTSEEVVAEIKARGLRLVDTTCPIVRRAQQEAARLASEGFAVIVFGEASHPEVRGILSWTRGRGAATTSLNTEIAPGPRGLAVISQTTQSPAAFAQFGRELEKRFASLGREVRAVDTTCPETARRYQAASALASEVDVLLVVGGRESANTRRLAEVGRAAGVPTHLIESADEMGDDWLRGAQRVGITAGASTPDDAIDEVVQRLERGSRPSVPRHKELTAKDAEERGGSPWSS